MTVDTPTAEFQEKLSKLLDIQLELVVNENRSTMLSLLEKKRNRARLSIHRMFLNAPEDVISAIAHYVRGTRRPRKDLIIRGYIQSNLPRYNYSYKINKDKLVSVGRYYNLKRIYDTLNKHYFQNKLDLDITWFGLSKRRQRRSRIIFGMYQDHLKLIKIHRIMDDPFFPDYFVRFVVYHEMLHEVVPGYVDEKGLFRIHGKEFKEREKQFEDYEKAILWEKKNKKQLFNF